MPPYPFHITHEVTFRDLDAMGHVNHAVYLTYMETARTRYLMTLWQLSQPQDMPVILAEVSCTYHAPAHFGEHLTIGVAIVRFGRKSFDMVYDIRSKSDLGNHRGRSIATGRTVMVMYDYQNSHSIPVPAEFKAQVEAFQMGWKSVD